MTIYKHSQIAKIFHFPLHPVFFAVYPVIALLAANILQIEATDAWRSLLVSAISSVLLWLGLRLIFHHWQKAAIICSLLLVLFFSYGHLYLAFGKSALFSQTLGRHRVLLPIWLALASGGIWMVWCRIKDTARWTQALNLFGIIVLMFPMIQIILYEQNVVSAQIKSKLKVAQAVPESSLRGSDLPDIYYIILDGYSREDVLKDYFGYDNQQFLDQLTGMGFYVARCSQSNYAQTELSLTSSLNFDYLESILDPTIENQGSSAKFKPWMINSRVRSVLDENGFSIVAFETGFSWDEIKDADVYLAPHSVDRIRGLNGFEVLFIRTTAGLVLTDAALSLPRVIQENLDNPQRRQYDRIRFALNELQTIPSEIKSPKFIFVHIIAPHGPFVLDSKGNYIYSPDPLSEDGYKAGYRDEVIFLNKEVILATQEILKNSARQPVIVIQGDHGHERAAPAERMEILNAYYIPDGVSQYLYPTISPVNTFRVIFNKFFNGSFSMLDDTSYYSTYQDPFHYKIIPNQNEDCTRIAGGTTIPTIH